MLRNPAARVMVGGASLLVVAVVVMVSSIGDKRRQLADPTKPTAHAKQSSHLTPLLDDQVVRTTPLLEQSWEANVTADIITDNVSVSAEEVAEQQSVMSLADYEQQFFSEQYDRAASEQIAREVFDNLVELEASAISADAECRETLCRVVVTQPLRLSVGDDLELATARHQRDSFAWFTDVGTSLSEGGVSNAWGLWHKREGTNVTTTAWLRRRQPDPQ